MSILFLIESFYSIVRVFIDTKVGNSSLTLTLTQILETRSCYFYEVILSTKQGVPEESSMPLKHFKIQELQGKLGR